MLKHNSPWENNRDMKGKMDRRYTFLIHTFYATGHVLPMQAVARALVDRGHNVIWLTHADQKSRVLASGAQFLPTEELAIVDSILQGDGPQPTTMDETVEFLLGGRVTAQVADLRRALAYVKDTTGGGADCLLHDALPFGAAALHELGEVPLWATLGVVPMWTPGENAQTALGMILSSPDLLLPCINRQRAELGIKPLGPLDPLNYSPFLHIQASCQSLEYGKSMPNTHFVGPLVTASQPTPDSLPAWWADVVDHPCVIGITQGTFAVDPTTLLIPAIEALYENDDLLLVVPSPRAETIRTALTSLSLTTEERGGMGGVVVQRSAKTTNTTLMKNVRLAEWVPYDVLLPRCRVLLTNGGYGSVTQSLSHGVPLICAGTSEDKKDTAARMVSVGAGIDLGTDTPSKEQIGFAVNEVLADATYRRNAASTGQELNSLGGAQRACDLLEDMVAREQSSSS